MESSEPNSKTGDKHNHSGGTKPRPSHTQPLTTNLPQGRVEREAHPCSAGQSDWSCFHMEQTHRHCWGQGSLWEARQTWTGGAGGVGTCTSAGTPLSQLRARKQPKDIPIATSTGCAQILSVKHSPPKGGLRDGGPGLRQRPRGALPRSRQALQEPTRTGRKGCLAASPEGAEWGSTGAGEVPQSQCLHSRLVTSTGQTVPAGGKGPTSFPGHTGALGVKAVWEAAHSQWLRQKQPDVLHVRGACVTQDTYAAAPVLCTVRHTLAT